MSGLIRLGHLTQPRVGMLGQSAEGRAIAHGVYCGACWSFLEVFAGQYPTVCVQCHQRSAIWYTVKPSHLMNAVQGFTEYDKQRILKPAGIKGE